jgi:hypothetical protein
MKIVRGITELKCFMRKIDCSTGCLADTGFLYGASDMDDLFYKQAQEVFEILEEQNIPVHTNVISRMEFVDLIFRKQLTIGAISLFESLNTQTEHKNLFDFLKKIRDDNTAAKRNKQSYKIGENQLKKLRAKIENSAGAAGWKSFCLKYAGLMLLQEWKILEEELGLYFIEVLDGQTSELIPNPLHWSDMIHTMGELGIRGPDSMIINLFKCSSLPLLITTDKDFNFNEVDDGFLDSKGVLILDGSGSLEN